MDCVPSIQLFLLLSVFSIISAAPVTSQLEPAEKFLQTCGYLAKVAEENQHYNNDIVIQALVRFQEDAGLPATGFFTEETMVRMNEYESVCNDVTKRRRRSIPVENRWPSNMITWDISRYSKWLTMSQVDQTTEQAFKMWSDAADVSFTRVSGGVIDIEIAFVEGDHGDVDFGGANKAIAHAFSPPIPASKRISIEGDVHLDDARLWTVESSTGNSLLVNLVHELGHSIGISHSSNNNDLMHNPPPPYHPSLKLSENDKAAARQLYGAKQLQPPVVLPVTSPAANPQPPIVDNEPGIISPVTPQTANPQAPVDNCPTSIDAATQMLTGEIILIKGDDVWKIVNNQLVANYPIKIAMVFTGLPNNIDAAMTMPTHMVEWGHKSGKTYFFKGKQVWRYTGFSLDDGYPSTIQMEFGVSLSKVDAAFTIGEYRGVYFVYGTQYFFKTPYQQIPALPTSSFDGFNTHAIAAVSGADDIIYLFGADGNYYKINPASDWSVVPGFPRSTSLWFGC